MAFPGTNYYGVLELERDASQQQINKAFRKLALKHHPDKHDGDEAAVLAFRAVAEAYEVLHDQRTRAIFDQYGETGLKDGVPNGRGGQIGGSYRFSGSPQRIFETFFGSSSPFGDIYGALADPASAGPDSSGPAFFGETTSMAPPVSAAQPRAVSKEVALSLGQLYRGDSLTVPHRRKLLNADGATTRSEEVGLRLQVQPGWAAGFKVAFPRAGDEGPATVPADVVLTLREAPSGDGFRRAGHDLVYTARVSLTDALCGSILSVPTLDGRTLSIGVTEVLLPGFVKTVPGEGMPLPLKAGEVVRPGVALRRGDLRIEFEILFPPKLSPAQRQAVRALKL